MEEDNKLAIENFRTAVLEVAGSDPNKPLTEERKTRIDKGIQQMFSNMRTPDHPPYAKMIHRALKELNEEGGSTEEAISDFIKKEYTDLPWAHNSMLSHHLEKLCERNEIVWSLDKSCYFLIDELMAPKPSSGSKGPKMKGLKKEGGTKGRPCKQ